MHTWTPYKAGTYDWPITNLWRVSGDSAVNDLVSMKQEHEIFNTRGAAEVRKHAEGQAHALSRGRPEQTRHWRRPARA